MAQLAACLPALICHNAEWGKGRFSLQHCRYGAMGRTEKPLELRNIPRPPRQVPEFKPLRSVQGGGGKVRLEPTQSSARMTGACGQKSPGAHTGAPERRTPSAQSRSGGSGRGFNGKTTANRRSSWREKPGSRGKTPSHLLDASHPAQRTVISENTKH